MAHRLVIFLDANIEPARPAHVLRCNVWTVFATHCRCCLIMMMMIDKMTTMINKMRTMMRRRMMYFATIFDQSLQLIALLH